MTPASRGFVSSVDRPLPVRVRADLVVEPQRYLGRDYWVVKDPLNLKYFRFEAEEYTLLSALDGNRSLDDLKRLFDQQFSPQRITHAELHRFIASLTRSSLLISSAPGQGPQLLRRAQESARKRRRATWASLMSFRFRGFDPDRGLERLNRAVGWFFSRQMILASLFFMAIAAVLVTVQFETFQQRLPAFQDFFAAQNWLWLALTLAMTKILHELGHGLACKRLGGDCHEMGVMLLVFTPCLYCNVSDAWMLPNKWHRAAIAAAGMYVELFLASICTVIWWFTHPGMLNYLCLNVMFVSSVSTVVFNANPLLRYDGYYILADVIEIPNLRQKANAVIRRKLGAWIAGLPELPDPFLPAKRRWLFAMFAVASAIYRWVVVFSIFWFVYRALEPYGLKIVGQFLGATALYSLFVAPLLQLIRFFHVPGRIQKVKPSRIVASSALLTVALAGVLMIPLPYWIECPVYVQPQDAQGVYVEIPGRLTQVHVQPGAPVAAGMPIVTLQNKDLDQRIVELEGKYSIEKAKAKAARYIETFDPTRTNQSDQLFRSAETLWTQLQNEIRNRDQLVVRATRSGTLLPSPYVRPKEFDEETDELPMWSGYALSEKNLGAHFDAGTLVGNVGDPQKFEAVLAVDQEQLESIRPGLDVEIQLDQLPTAVLHSSIDRIATSKMREVPQALAGQFGGRLAAEVAPGGEVTPLNPTYQVSASLPPRDDWLPNGAIGGARIHVGQRTVGWRLWRWAMRTFHFEL